MDFYSWFLYQCCIMHPQNFICGRGQEVQRNQSSRNLATHPHWKLLYRRSLGCLPTFWLCFAAFHSKMLSHCLEQLLRQEVSHLVELDPKILMRLVIHLLELSAVADGFHDFFHHLILYFWCHTNSLHYWTFDTSNEPFVTACLDLNFQIYCFWHVIFSFWTMY